MQTADRTDVTLTPQDLPLEPDEVRERIARMRAADDPRAAMEGELRQALPELTDDEVAVRVEAYVGVTARYAAVRDDERPARTVLAEAIDRNATGLSGDQRRVLYLTLIALGEAELESAQAEASGTAPQTLQEHIDHVERRYETTDTDELRDLACAYDGETALALAVGAHVAREAAERGEGVQAAAQGVRDDARDRSLAACAWHIEASLGTLGDAFTDCDAQVMTGLVNAAADQAQVRDEVASGKIDETEAEDRLGRIALAFKVILIEALTITLGVLTILSVGGVVTTLLGAAALAAPLGFLAGTVAMCALNGIFQDVSIVVVEGTARLISFAKALAGRLARYARVRGAAVVSAVRERVSDFVEA